MLNRRDFLKTGSLAALLAQFLPILPMPAPAAAPVEHSGIITLDHDWCILESCSLIGERLPPETRLQYRGSSRAISLLRDHLLSEYPLVWLKEIPKTVEMRGRDGTIECLWFADEVTAIYCLKGHWQPKISMDKRAGVLLPGQTGIHLVL
jgi:hypothetical protein